MLSSKLEMNHNLIHWHKSFHPKDFQSSLFYRSLCEDLPAVQQTANHEEEDAHQEKNTQPSLQ